MSEEKANEVFSSVDLVSPCVTINSNRKRRFFSSINEVSPSVVLAENLEILTTSSAKKSWKSTTPTTTTTTEIWKARRSLSFIGSPECQEENENEKEGKNEHQEGAGLNRMFCKEKKISIDDGCFVSSPGISSNSSSPESNFRHSSAASSNRQNVSFKRFTSLPFSGQQRTKRSSSVCLFPQLPESNIFDRRRNSEDDKENRAFMAPQQQFQTTASKVTFTSTEELGKPPVLVSCLKSPTVTPKIKRVAFRNETNSRDIRTSRGKVMRSSSHMMSTRCRRPCSSSNLKRQQSIDDGFFDQSSPCNDDVSSRLDLPMNFEKLFFSPVIECHNEMEMSSRGENNDDFLLEETSSNSPTTFGQSPPSCGVTSVRTQSTFLTPLAPCDGPSDRPGVGASRCLFEKKSSERNDISNESNSMAHARRNRFGTKSFFVSQCRPRNVLRSESVDEQKLCHPPVISKRRKSDVADCNPQAFASFSMLTKCQSELCIKRALNMDDVHQDLIGDFSKKYSLPLIRGKHQDLKSISIDTMASLLRDAYSNVVDRFTVIDCRYPYEFRGGHIKGALNIHNTSDLLDMFLTNCFEKDDNCEENGDNHAGSDDNDVGDSNDNDVGGSNDNDTCDVSSPSIPKRNIIIFHCEFSSERGPKLSRFLRNKDREQNANSYPFLHYPELYLLEGGYKAFYEVHPDLCEPQGYIPMLHPNHSTDLRLFRNKSCSWLGSKSLSKSLF